MITKMQNCVKLVEKGKTTGNGAWEQTLLLSTKQKKIIEPMHSHSSRTGNHWADIWYLLPGRYVVVQFYRTGNGNHHHKIVELKINKNLSTKEKTIAKYENNIELPLPEEYSWVSELDQRIKKYFIINAWEEE